MDRTARLLLMWVGKKNPRNRSPKNRLVQVKSLLPKLLVRANPLQRLLQMDLLQRRRLSSVGFAGLCAEAFSSAASASNRFVGYNQL